MRSQIDSESDGDAVGRPPGKRALYRRQVAAEVELHRLLHELRTLLTPLKLWLQSALKTLGSKDEPPSPEQLAHRLTKAARQADRLTRLVDDFTASGSLGRR